MNNNKNTQCMNCSVTLDASNGEDGCCTDCQELLDMGCFDDPIEEWEGFHFINEVDLLLEKLGFDELEEYK